MEDLDQQIMALEQTLKGMDDSDKNKKMARMAQAKTAKIKKTSIISSSRLSNNLVLFPEFHLTDHKSARTISRN